MGIKVGVFFFLMELQQSCRPKKRKGWPALYWKTLSPHVPIVSYKSQRLSSNRFPDCREKRERTGGGGGEILVR